MSQLIEPHGGILCELLLKEDQKRKIQNESLQYKTLTLNDRQLCDIEMLLNGGFSPLKGFMVRKEPKGHGMQRYIEGPVEAGNRVVIVEDVTTTGGSSLIAIDRAVEFGLKVERVITVIDRLAGAAEAFAARGIPLDPLVTIRDLGIEPE